MPCTSFYRKLPNYNFAAVGVGGLKLVVYTLFTIITIEQAPQNNVALLMQLGVDGVFVGLGILQAVTYYADADKLAEISEDLGQAMVGINYREEKESWEGRETAGK